MYVRHLAWLDSAPKDQKRSRRTHFGEDTNYTNMPDVAGFQYVVDLFFEVLGPYMGGIEPLSLQEIKAWCDLSGVYLAPWEAVAIRSMSRAYVVQFNRSNDSNEPPPYYEATRVVDIGAKLKQAAQRNGN